MIKSFRINTSLTCISCRLLFSSADEQRDHYKSDFHKFNLKRKVASLPPISFSQFEKSNQGKFLKFSLK